MSEEEEKAYLDDLAAVGGDLGDVDDGGGGERLSASSCEAAPRGVIEKRIAKYWAFICYSEKKGADFLRYARESLRGRGIDWAISPIHSPDDEAKKRHQHVLLAFRESVSRSMVEGLIDEVFPRSDVMLSDGTTTRARVDVSGVVQLGSKLQQRDGYICYLIHLKNPDKQQFEDIPCDWCAGASSLPVREIWDNARVDEFYYEWVKRLASGEPLSALAAESLFNKTQFGLFDSKISRLVAWANIFREDSAIDARENQKKLKNVSYSTLGKSKLSTSEKNKNLDYDDNFSLSDSEADDENGAV